MKFQDRERIHALELTVDVNLPALGFDGANRRPTSGPVSVKWLVALFILAVAATLLILGALRTLGPHLHFAATPAVFRRVVASVARRGDRLALSRRRTASAITRSRIEQLDDSGLGTTPFTHVIAHLVGFSGAPNPGAAASAGRKLDPRSQMKFWWARPQPRVYRRASPLLRNLTASRR